MSDGAESDGLAHVDRNGDAATDIDRLLADFRLWLEELNAPVAADSTAQPAVDLFTLVAQFTALRHEVNMQTRAVRAAVEQNAEVVKQLTAVEPPDPSDALRPVAKAVIDIADALSLSLRQMEKFDETAGPLLQPPAFSPGVFARLFGSAPPPPDLGKLKQLVAAAADGYSLSLRRIERLLPELQLEAIDCRGEPFDPVTMEAVEVLGHTGQPSGFVVDVVRPGYLWNGKVFRFAQVKVAR